MLAKNNTNNYLSEVRASYHSLNTNERAAAIQKLAEQKTSDSIRELIYVFQECAWRETKFQVLKAIPINIDLRALEFLFSCVKQVDDLPLAEAAIHALGESKNLWAAKFLNQFYLYGHESLRPACVQALAKMADYTNVDIFIGDLHKYLKLGQIHLVKSIILACGELKAHQAIESLIEVAKNKQYRDVALSAVVSLGKIARDVKYFDNIEPYYKNDAFEYQIFTTAKNQCQFRSQWKIEDYLAKLLKGEKLHPAIFLEFNSFSQDEVKVALDMLVDMQNQNSISNEILFQVLAKLKFSNVINWYKEYCANLPDFSKDLIYASLAQHNDLNLAELKTDLLNSDYVWTDAYISAHLFNTIKPDSVMAHIFDESHFAKFSSHEQIRILNLVHNYLLSVSSNVKLYDSTAKVLESWFLKASKIETAVVARVVRVFAQLSYSSVKLNEYIYALFTNEHLRKSVLMYFQSSGGDYFYNKSLKDVDLHSQEREMFLKLLVQCKSNPFTEKVFDNFFSKVSTDSDNKIKNVFIKLLAKHKPAGFKDYIIRQSTFENHLVQMQSIMAMKGYADEGFAEPLAKFLEHKSKSISGRALDALLSLPGNRAKRLVFDFFTKNYSDLDVAEKITRSFQPPDNDTDYYILAMAKIIQQTAKDYSLYDRFIEFHDELVVHQRSFMKKTTSPTAADLLAIDADIRKIITAYDLFDESSKSALRSAEVTYRHPELFDNYVDKSSIVLGYCKAIDIVFEKQLGKKFLFPKIENKLSEFQNVLHLLTLNEDYPQVSRVLKLLNLEKHFSEQSLPVHKMGLIAQGFLNGKIINDHFKILDGLRAWAIVILLFSRSHQALPKPLLLVKSSESDIVLLAKKLIWLQDIRNPIAHRQTVVDFKNLEQIRSEAFVVLKLMNEAMFE